MKKAEKQRDNCQLKNVLVTGFGVKKIIVQYVSLVVRMIILKDVIPLFFVIISKPWL